MFKELSAPICIQWELTSDCNYKCLHCYNYWCNSKKTKDDVSDIGKLKRLWKKATEEIINSKIFDVTLTGGEPLIVIEDAFEYIYRLKNEGIGININSNLALMTDSIAKQLKNLGVAGILTSLPSAVSLNNDYITQTNESLAKTINGIKIAISNGLRVSVNMVISKHNISDIYETAKLVKSLGIESFSATRAAMPGNCRDFSEHQITNHEFRYMLNELLRVKKIFNLAVSSLEFYPYCSFKDETLLHEFGNRICSAGKTNLTIGFDGKIRPCSHAIQSYGSIYDGLKLAWQGMDSYRTNEYLPQECQSCEYKYMCMGGCKMEAFLKKGNYSSPDSLYEFDNTFSQKIIIENTQEFNVAPNERFHLNAKLKYRHEEFGMIVYLNPSCWLPINNELFHFLMNGRNSFTLDLMCKSLNISLAEGINVVKMLSSKKIILKEC